MIDRQPGHLHFSPALPCINCQQETNHGRIAQVGSLGWQLLLLCGAHSEGPSRSDEEGSLSALRSHIDEQLAMIQRLQRKKRRIAQAYTQLRRQHTLTKARRSLRWKLNWTYKLQAEAMEVEHAT